MDLLRVEWGLSPLKFIWELNCHLACWEAGPQGRCLAVERRDLMDGRMLELLREFGRALCLLHAPTCSSAFPHEVKKLKASPEAKQMQFVLNVLASGTLGYRNLLP